MAKSDSLYPASLEIDYAKKRNRLTVFFRSFLSIPILIVVSVLTETSTKTGTTENGGEAIRNSSSIATALFAATALMILFRQRYPRWWFDFNLQLNKFTTRVGAYVFLLTDHYPSTEDEQAVHLDVQYPNVKKELNRVFPLFKWLLAIPHYIVLSFLILGAMFATIFAWFFILITGTYPKGLFDYVVGVGRWALRVNAYATLLTTDKYPPFSLK